MRVVAIRLSAKSVGLAALVTLCLGCESLTPPTAPSASLTPQAPGRYEVTIVGHGVMLGGVLVRSDAAHAQPAIVVLHGWLAPGMNGAATVEGEAQRLAGRGYATLALALRGWPPSGGQDDCGLRQPDDVAEAINWLRRQPGVAGDRIALVGFSQGAQVALLAAGRGAQVRGVVAYYPVTDVTRWKATTDHPQVPEYVATICESGGTRSRSPLLSAANITADVLLVHGDTDRRVPTEQSVLLHTALIAAGRRSNLLLVPGAQHGFSLAEQTMVRPSVDQFLDAVLR
jgi:dipeptidyl aminopeptidase/acylaminoacyl peptidase